MFQIRLALNVQGKTAVQYRPTSRLINTTRYTEISIDFRATRVQGSLFYLSDGSSSRVSVQWCYTAVTKGNIPERSLASLPCPCFFYYFFTFEIFPLACFIVCFSVRKFGVLFRCWRFVILRNFTPVLIWRRRRTTPYFLFRCSYVAR